MKQDWYPDELTQHWTLSAEERELLDSKTSATRLSFALLLKAFQFDGRFPDRREDIAGEREIPGGQIRGSTCGLG